MKTPSPKSLHHLRAVRFRNTREINNAYYRTYYGASIQPEKFLRKMIKRWPPSEGEMDLYYKWYTNKFKKRGMQP